MKSYNVHDEEMAQPYLKYPKNLVPSSINNILYNIMYSPSDCRLDQTGCEQAISVFRELSLSKATAIAANYF